MYLFTLCLKIFFARIIDVTLGTIRTVYTVKGKTFFAGIIAFFEIFIWFTIAKEALNTNIESIWIAIFYAAGYATGTIIGTYISNNFINSLITIEVITDKITKENISKIRNNGFGVSVVDTIYNYQEDVNKKILYITLNSRHLTLLEKEIKLIDPKAFIVINESKIVQNGIIK